MSRILYIVANTKKEGVSYSKMLGKAFLDSYMSLHPNDDLEVLDLYAVGVPYLDEIDLNLLSSKKSVDFTLEDKKRVSVRERFLS